MGNGKSSSKRELVIFSSGKVAKSGVTNAIRDELKKFGFAVTPWTEGFFPENEIALNRFLKQLLCFDAALVVLGNDDIRLDPAQADKQQHVPRDNVIFELGACMARLGPKKTFIVRPESPEVVLPSYFHGVGGHLTYETGRADSNWNAAVGSACNSVANLFDNFDSNSFFSDLPASGLAYGYFHNFLMPTYQAFNGGKPDFIDDVIPKWDRKCGFKLTVVIPDEPLNRDAVEHLFTSLEPVNISTILGDDRHLTARRRLRFVHPQLRLLDGRNIAIYAKQRRKKSDPFEIFDVPTTLLTSQKVIDKVEAFWGAGDKIFKNRLTHREAVNFERTLLPELKKTPEIAIVEMADFEKVAFEF